MQVWTRSSALRGSSEKQAAAAWSWQLLRLMLLLTVLTVGWASALPPSHLPAPPSHPAGWRQVIRKSCTDGLPQASASQADPCCFTCFAGLAYARCVDEF